MNGCTADVPVRRAQISEPEGLDQSPHTWTHRLLPCLSLVLCDISLLLLDAVGATETAPCVLGGVGRAVSYKLQICASSVSEELQER